MKKKLHSKKSKTKLQCQAQLVKMPLPRLSWVKMSAGKP